MGVLQLMAKEAAAQLSFAQHDLGENWVSTTVISSIFTAHLVPEFDPLHFPIFLAKKHLAQGAPPKAGQRFVAGLADLGPVPVEIQIHLGRHGIFRWGNTVPSGWDHNVGKTMP